MTYITQSQFVNNLWITYHQKKKVSNKMSNLMSLMLDYPSFCMNNRKNCKSICKSCYAFIQTSIRGKSLWPKLKHNSHALSTSSIQFDKIESPLNVLRFSSYGELNDKTQCLNMILTAKHNPHLSTALWTKRYNLIKSLTHLKPPNLNLVWSCSRVNCTTFIIPKGFTKSFYVYRDVNALQDAKSQALNKGYNVVECSKQCDQCLVCYRNDQPMIIMELLK